MTEPVTLEEVLKLANQLPLAEKVRLIEKIAPQIRNEMNRELRQAGPAARRSLSGLWRGHDTPPADIDQARREMWRDFPRQDI